MSTRLKKDDLKAPAHVTTVSGVMDEVEQRIAGVSMPPQIPKDN